MEDGFAGVVLIVLGIWLLIFILFGISFVKNKYASTLSFMAFIIISAFYSYGTEEAIKVIDTSNSKGSSMVNYSIISFILIIASSVLWVIKRKTLARWLGIISILVTILINMKI